MASVRVRVSQDTTTSSVRRRKPLYTTKSPSPGSASFPHPALAARLPTLTPSPTRSVTPATLTLNNFRPIAYAFGARGQMDPPLPLYHPLGKLASSLPPLDAAIFGLPPLARTATTTRVVKVARSESSVSASTAPVRSGSGRRPVRARRAVAKLRDGSDATSGALATTTTADENQLEDTTNSDERQDGGSVVASPRKRGGRQAKRKRKDLYAEDGDAAYPAKRPRLPRQSTSSKEDQEESEEAQLPAPDVAFDEASSPQAVTARRRRLVRESNSPATSELAQATDTASNGKQSSAGARKTRSHSREDEQ